MQDGRSVSQDPREYVIEIGFANTKIDFSQPVLKIQLCGFEGVGREFHCIEGNMKIY